MDDPNTRNKIDAIIDDYGELARQRLRDEATFLFESSESPIERILGTALLSALFEVREVIFDVRGPGNTVPDGSDSFIVPQALFAGGRYRADFYVHTGPIKSPTRIVIECDGHDYHERTKQQAARDRQRDRWFQIRGIIVLRFTGSEIWADPQACAGQVIEAIYKHAF